MRDKGIWKILVIFMVLVVIGSCAAMPSAGGVSESEVKSSSATIYVPDDYLTIQEAVDAASAGDAIIVRDGIYIENIKVNKRLTIQSENGADKTTIKAANPKDHVFKVTTDYVNIRGFTVKSAAEACGINLGNASYCNISNNIASNNVDGISLWISRNNIITGNNVSNNNGDGIYLSDSGNNILTNNTVKSNNFFGIGLVFSSNNTITKNNISNSNDGIHLAFGNNKITKNAILNNWHGIFLASSNNNKITKNNILKNHDGIYLAFPSSSNAIYLNNFINNTDNVYYNYNLPNICNSTEEIIYTYNGTNYENYLGCVTE